MKTTFRIQHPGLKIEIDTDKLKISEDAKKKLVEEINKLESLEEVHHVSLGPLGSHLQSHLSENTARSTLSEEGPPELDILIHDDVTVATK